MKTTYFPCMCDHAHPIAAAFTAFGIPAAVLPRSDRRTLVTALELMRGRECLPCFMTTGDIVKKCREPGLDPAETRFFMPTGHGPCRTAGPKHGSPRALRPGAEGRAPRGAGPGIGESVHPSDPSSPGRP